MTCSALLPISDAIPRASLRHCAGAPVAMRSARDFGTESCSTMIDTARTISRSAPARVPSSSVSLPFRLSILRPFRRNSVMSDPTVDMASVTRNISPGPCLAESATAMLVACTWISSAIRPADTFCARRVAPTRPGSRFPIWLIALKRCVTHLAPASNAVDASAQLQSVCPSDTITPADAWLPGRENPRLPVPFSE